MRAATPFVQKVLDNNRVARKEARVALIANRCRENYNIYHQLDKYLRKVRKAPFISALREWMAELGLRNSVAVSVWGKVKTAAQMLALIALLSRYNELVIDIGFGLLFIATALTVSSMVSYLRAAITTLSNEER